MLQSMTVTRVGAKDPVGKFQSKQLISTDTAYELLQETKLNGQQTIIAIQGNCIRSYRKQELEASKRRR